MNVHNVRSWLQRVRSHNLKYLVYVSLVVQNISGDSLPIRLIQFKMLSNHLLISQVAAAPVVYHFLLFNF